MKLSLLFGIAGSEGPRIRAAKTPDLMTRYPIGTTNEHRRTGVLRPVDDNVFNFLVPFFSSPFGYLSCPKFLFLLPSTQKGFHKYIPLFQGMQIQKTALTVNFAKVGGLIVVLLPL